ncbi:MAG: bifunctional UDP-sugar hydrolase/5'-nucleotidase [Oscillospiraceae bacterium]
MKKLLGLALALAMIFSGCGGAPKALDKDLVVLYTNDVHCGVDEAIGYAGVAAYKAELEEAGNYVVLVDAGDAIQGAPIGTMSQGEYVVDIMNKVGYDIAIPGNHEFDYGMEKFLELSKKAEYEYISANFKDLTTGKTVFKPYTIKEFNGVKVAFVGACTPKTVTSSTPAYFMNDKGEFLYDFCQDDSGAEFYASVQTAVDGAKKEGADYIVALTHLGIEAEVSPYMSTQLIENTNGIDVVLDGHSHSVLECERVKNKDGEFVLLSSTGTKLNNLGMLVISKSGNISTGLVKNYETKDAQTEAVIKELQSKFEKVLGEVVAKTEYDLVINDPKTDVRLIRNAETNLGDLCADAYRAAAGAQIAFVNGGGIRAPIKKGDITYKDILTVQPFGNSLCMVEATGQEILDALEMGARVTPSENGGFLQVSGLTYSIKPTAKSTVELDENGMFIKVGGAYRVSEVKVGEEALDLGKKYTLACHDYMIKNGGDGFTMFKDNVILKDTIMLDNQVLLSYITKDLKGVVGEGYSQPYGEGRIGTVK